MITRDELKEMCMNSDNTEAYFRPFIIKGEITKGGIFLIGINPATPIFAENIVDIEEYIDLILNYDDFMDYYKQLRISNGKPELSRTRMGINNFTEWLSELTNLKIIETNVNTYPTPKPSLLRKEPEDIQIKGKENFLNLLNKLTPKLLVVHSKEAIEELIKLLESNKIIGSINIPKTINEIEKTIPLITFKYLNGETATIIACRHLRSYGKEGYSYQGFKDKIKDLLLK